MRAYLLFSIVLKIRTVSGVYVCIVAKPNDQIKLQQAQNKPCTNSLLPGSRNYDRCDFNFVRMYSHNPKQLEWINDRHCRVIKYVEYFMFYA